MAFIFDLFDNVDSKFMQYTGIVTSQRSLNCIRTHSAGSSFNMANYEKVLEIIHGKGKAYF